MYDDAGKMSVRLAANAAMCAGLTATRGRLVNVASPLAETRDDTLAGSVPATHGCQAEHLEAFSLAHACQLLHVDTAGVHHLSGVLILHQKNIALYVQVLN